MAKHKKSSNSRQATKSRRASSSSRNGADSSEGFGLAATASSIVSNVMATVNAGSSLKGSLEHFSKALEPRTLQSATITVEQVQQTIEHGVETLAHAKETFDLAKIAVSSARDTAKEVFAQIKEKPEPFVAAAIPALVGLYMFFRQSQGQRSTMMTRPRLQERAVSIQ